ncbi:MAG TPA: indolepyruvate oxidoreductase subunit beta family protein [Xanthobacteraceae bacterium]|nr:indolepyruvate oxidoreductase subunit beta family protein [Xanthobacteraceae bacterium]
MNEATIKLRPISVAVLALGGEGGGVLADWIANLAEKNGYLAQATSVPGVAQRTGATIYYVELFPVAAAKAAGREPVLALMPVPGDVDIVVASELMEAARAVERGFVTPDRTTLIASTHRVFAMSERTALADGRADSAALLESCRSAARRLVAFDMAAMAEAPGSVISAVLFGALAGSGALPFPRPAFEATIRRAGVGVASSLAAFGAAYEAVQSPPETGIADKSESEKRFGPAIDSLLASVAGDTAPDTRAIVRAGVERLIDYQDERYARLYLARLLPIAQLDRAPNQRLLGETARQLALAMSYEDTIRVADLKTRRSRFERVRDEVRIADGQILEIVEFMHPRTEEIADTLPAGVGRWLLRTNWARRFVDRFTRKGRTVRTTSVGGFTLLYFVAALKSLRPRSLRYVTEQDAIENWLAAVRQYAADYELGVGVARLRGLVKGYGDTHAHGRDKFEAIAARLPQIQQQPDAAGQLDALLLAANADESGDALRAAIAKLS